MAIEILPYKCPKCMAARGSEYASLTCGYFHSSNTCPMQSEPHRWSGCSLAGVEVTCGEMLEWGLTGKVPRNVQQRAKRKAARSADVKPPEDNDEQPWQQQIAGYQVRDGGIYLRDYNVRVAEFAPNSHALRAAPALARMFDAAHAVLKSERRAMQPKKDKGEVT